MLALHTRGYAHRKRSTCVELRVVVQVLGLRFLSTSSVIFLPQKKTAKN
jgi:hypothetical protein